MNDLSADGGLESSPAIVPARNKEINILQVNAKGAWGAVNTRSVSSPTWSRHDPQPVVPGGGGGGGGGYDDETKAVKEMFKK